jgi:hypothetical protein
VELDFADQVAGADHAFGIIHCGGGTLECGQGIRAVVPEFARGLLADAVAFIAQLRHQCVRILRWSGGRV